MVVVVAPFAAAPASELCAVNHAAIPILKHALSPVRTPRKNPQHLRISLIGIHIERTVIQSERPVLTRHFPQSLRNIHVSALAAILGAKNHEGTLASAIPIAAPAPATPLPTTPVMKHRSIDQAVIPKLKHPFPSIRTLRKNV